MKVQSNFYHPLSFELHSGLGWMSEFLVLKYKSIEIMNSFTVINGILFISIHSYNTSRNNLITSRCNEENLLKGNDKLIVF